MAGDGVVLEERAFAVLAAEDEPALDDLREDQNAGRIVGQLLGCLRILQEQLEGLVRIAINRLPLLRLRQQRTDTGGREDHGQDSKN